jgi:hypothetical protein
MLRAAALQAAASFLKCRASIGQWSTVFLLFSAIYAALSLSRFTCCSSAEEKLPEVGASEFVVLLRSWVAPWPLITFFAFAALPLGAALLLLKTALLLLGTAPLLLGAALLRTLLAVRGLDLVFLLLLTTEGISGMGA